MQLSRMLSMNLPLIDALEHLKMDMRSDLCIDRHRMQDAISSLIRDLKQGLTFSQSLARYPGIFPAVFVRLASAGQISERLPALLEEAALFMERNRVLRLRYADIITYPVTIMVVLIGIVQFLVIYILPTFVSLFEGMQIHLPLVTKLVIAVARAVRNPHLSLSAFLILVFLIVISIFWKRYKGYYLHDFIIFRLPLIGRVTAIKEYATFSTLMGSILSASLPLREALATAASALENSYMKACILHAADESNFVLSEVLRASGVFQPSCLWMVLAGERTETLGEIMMEMGQFYQEESRILSTRFLGWLKPLLVLVTGVFTAIIIVSVFIPLVQIVLTITKDIVL